MKKTLLAIALTVPFAFAAQTANPPAKSADNPAKAASSDNSSKPAAKKHSKKAPKKSTNSTGSSTSQK